jgi:hypothetical protein
MWSVERLSIGEFATRSRLSHKALRLYDELGLLVPAAVDPETELRDQVRMVLAPLAIYLGNLMQMAPPGFAEALGIHATAEELRAAAMEAALELAGGGAE